MQAIVQPSAASGVLTAPASKSAMQRACAAALIRGGTTVLHNPGIAADDLASIQLIRKLGASVQPVGDALQVTSKGLAPVSKLLHCGESGLSVRMFTSIAATSGASFTINGKGSLLRRPVDFFDEVLPQLGVSCSSNKGFLPLHIEGPMQPADITIDGTQSSQYLTGLLMAYAAAGASGVTITVKGLASKPYIDLTLQLMHDFGLAVPVNEGYEYFHFPKEPVSATPDVLHYTIEGDWSGAAFLLVAGALGGPLEVRGLQLHSPQADRAILTALEMAGASIQLHEDRVQVQRKELQAFHFNAVDCPDLFPPLVALAAHCNGESVIEGVHRLAHKESNRAATLAEEFGKMGMDISFRGDAMIVRGGTLRGAQVHAHEDHRIAMACAVAALNGNDATTVNGAEAVNKSYPQFWQHLQHAGAMLTLHDI